MTSFTHDFLCLMCKRLEPFTGAIGEPLLVCDAFPGGVPEAIFKSRVDHREPYPGDHDLQFVPKVDNEHVRRRADALFERQQMTAREKNEEAESWRRNRSKWLPGGIYLNEEAERFSDAIRRWRESGYDSQVMYDAGFWVPPEE